MFEPQNELVRRLTELTARRVPDRSWRMERFVKLLEEAGPHWTGVPLVKVTGTNGKGSVCAMLEACLGAAGRRVGLSTSPHLERITERIRIDGCEITPERFEEHLVWLEGFLEDFLGRWGERYTPSFFEALLLVSFRAFEAEEVDFLLYEAGIGGAHDPTSLIPGFLSVLTTVGFDHEGELGETLTAIATEKTGIASPGSALVLGSGIQGEIKAVVEDAVRQRGLRLRQAQSDSVHLRERTSSGMIVDVRTSGGELRVRLPLHGSFQLDNLATVVAAMEEIRQTGILPHVGILAAVERTRWAARMELIEGEPSWLLDGAHNEQAVGALAETVQQLRDGRDCILLYGSTARKRYQRYLPRLGEIATEAWITDDFDDAEDREVLAGEAAKSLKVGAVSGSLEELLERLLARSGRTLVVVAGSLYLVGRTRSWLGAHGRTGS